MNKTNKKTTATTNTDTPTADIKIGKISALWTERQGLSHSYFESTTSTNDYAKQEAFDLSANEIAKIYFADEQTNGRGRFDRKWVSAKSGSQLLSTWSFSVMYPAQPTLSILVGMSLYRAALSTWPFLNWSLKAPNDLFLNGKKVAGLLTEVVTQGAETRWVIGLGMNVFSIPKIDPKPDLPITCLTHELPNGFPLMGEDWTSFLDRWFFELTAHLGREDFSLSPTEQKVLLLALNSNPNLKSKFTAIEADGTLIVDDDDEIKWTEL